MRSNASATELTPARMRPKKRFEMEFFLGVLFMFWIGVLFVGWLQSRALAEIQSSGEDLETEYEPGVATEL